MAGAKEIGLPGDYIQKLEVIYFVKFTQKSAPAGRQFEAFETNDYSGSIGVPLEDVTGASCDGIKDH